MDKSSNIEQNTKHTFLERIARMYYILGLNQKEISEQLGIGRSSVARFLMEAKRIGIVEFHIRSPLENWRCRSLERELEQASGLKDCVVFQTQSGHASSFETLAAQYLDTVLPTNGVIGLGWGETLYAIGKQLHLCDPRPNLKVVQLSGGSGTKEEFVPATSVIQLWATALKGKPYYLPAPVIAASVEAKQAFLQDPSVQEVIAVYEHMPVAVVGIGHTSAHATIMKANLTAELSSDELSKHSVGDVIFHFFDREGEFSHPRLSQRVVGASPEEFFQIPLRIGAAHGSDKVEAILGALRGKLVHTLLTSEETAQAVLDSLNIEIRQT